MSFIRAPLFFLLLLSFSCITGVARAAATGSIHTAHHQQFEYPKMSKVTPLQAVHRASKIVKGDIHSVALESEHGILIYEVDIISPRTGLHEIGIDAGSAKFLFNKYKNTATVISASR